MKEISLELFGGRRWLLTEKFLELPGVMETCYILVRVVVTTHGLYP